MVRKVNKGLSLVEVVIALAIFMLMMVPIVSSLISSMKTTGTAKELQSRNEYAQNLIETVKEVPIDALKTSEVSYFEKVGAEGVSITPNTKEYPNATDPNRCAYDEYVIKGTTYLGVERTKYSYAVEVSSATYAKEEYDLGKKDPNHVKSGVVQDLDQDKVALIGATLSNNDTPAYKELLKKKLSAKKEKEGSAYDAVAAANSFIGDTGSRIIEIKVSKDVSNEYDVICNLYYSDNCSQMAVTGVTIGKEVGMVEYKDVYKKHFKKLPDIYLMYNLCVYNNQYAKEYIIYDVSGLADTDKVNVFVVETASDYSNSVKAADTKNVTDGGNSWLKGGTGGLYQKAGGSDRDSEVIYMAQNDSATGGILKVYHNMYEPSDVSSGWNNKKNKDLIYDNGAATDVMNLFNDSTRKYKALSDIKEMHEAQDGNRGLYEIKVWMQQGDSVDTSKNPILQGTRGGGEID